MKKYVLLLTLPLLIACNNNGMSSHESTKSELEAKEISTPQDFLEVEQVEWWINLIGETVIKTSIRSNAKVAKFKDIKLIVTYYSKTNSIIGEEETVIYEFIEPSQVLSQKLKLNAPPKTETINIKVKGAKYAK